MSTAVAKRKVHPELFPRDADAGKIGRLYNDGLSSVSTGILKLIEAGYRLIEKKGGDDMKRGQWLPWLAAHADELGFDERQTRRLIQAAQIAIKLGWKPRVGISDASVRFTDQQLLEISRTIFGHAADSQLVQQSNSNEHYTPKQYIEAARKRMRKINRLVTLNVIQRRFCRRYTIDASEDRFVRLARKAWDACKLDATIKAAMGAEVPTRSQRREMHV